MNTITKTHLVTDVTAGGTTLHRVPTVRWTLANDEAGAHIDLVSCTAITAVEGDRRDVVTLLSSLINMGFDLDVNEDDRTLEWLIGYDGHVWGVAPETVHDHCEAALASYQAPCPVA